MDDLRYQVDMLKASVNTYAENEKIYKLICKSSKRVFVYYKPSTGVIKTFGNWDEYSDIKINDFQDLLNLTEFFIEEDRDKIRSLFLSDSYSSNSDEKITVRKTDRNSFIEIQSISTMDLKGDCVEKLFSFADVTKDHKMQDELSFLAYYDFVTGLYNRNYYIQKLSQFIEKAKEENAIISIMILDIDDFHKINDSLGIIYGDEVIQQFGFFLKNFVSENIIAARFDGDIYSLAIYDKDGNQDINLIYNAIKERLTKPFVLTNGTEISFSVSVGVSEYPESGENALELVNGAEIVMLKVKDAGKNEIKYFDSAILNEFLNQVNVENKLKLAVSGMDFSLNFQPQYYADGNKFRGVEVLLRWKDAEGNMISPSVFIPIAEKNGSIISIGDWVLDTSIKTFMEWKRKFGVDMILSVNISSLQYKKPDFVNKVISTINKYEMIPEELELEITESVLIDDINLVFEKMDELRDFGVKISIDDFGTGYSSLSYLKRLPADTLKIDKSFVDSVTKDNATKVIVKSIIDMTKSLGYKTVAEGVEEKEQLEVLNELGCDMIQGFYLAKPVTADKIEDILLRLI